MKYSGLLVVSFALVMSSLVHADYPYLPLEEGNHWEYAGVRRTETPDSVIIDSVTWSRTITAVFNDSTGRGATYVESVLVKTYGRSLDKGDSGVGLIRTWSESGQGRYLSGRDYAYSTEPYLLALPTAPEHSLTLRSFYTGIDSLPAFTVAAGETIRTDWYDVAYMVVGNIPGYRLSMRTRIDTGRLVHQNEMTYLDGVGLYELRFRTSMERTVEESVFRLEYCSINGQEIAYLPLVEKPVIVSTDTSSGVYVDDDTLEFRLFRVNNGLNVGGSTIEYTWVLDGSIVACSRHVWKSMCELATANGTQLGTAGGLTLDNSWATAGFTNTPDGSITITENQAITMTYVLDEFETPADLMAAVNRDLSMSLVDGGGAVVLIDGGCEYALSETGEYGFWSEAGISFVDTSMLLQDLNAEGYIDNYFISGDIAVNDRYIPIDISRMTLGRLIASINDSCDDVEVVYEADFERIQFRSLKPGNSGIHIEDYASSSIINAFQLVGSSQLKQSKFYCVYPESLTTGPHELTVHASAFGDTVGHTWLFTVDEPVSISCPGTEYYRGGGGTNTIFFALTGLHLDRPPLIPGIVIEYDPAAEVPLRKRLVQP